MKRFCKNCGEWKDGNEFYAFKGKYPKEYKCKPCVGIRRKEYYSIHHERLIKIARLYRSKNRERVLHGKRKQTYGITTEKYNQMLAEQGSVCAVCKKPEESKIGKGPLAHIKNSLSVDHDHKRSELIRGLLCSCCNRALGYLKEDPVIMQSLIEYIKKYQK